MKILQQLDRPNFRASKSDRILLQYIKRHADLFCMTPIASLAVNCGVSEATITRFVRKMGFSSLQFFKLTLNEELADSKKYLIVNSDIYCGEPISATARKILARSVDNLENTSAGLDMDVLADVASAFQRARNIFFIGTGNSGFVAADMAYKFMQIGLNAKGIDNSGMMMLQMALLQKEDVVAALNHSGKSKEISEALCLAKKSGAKTVLITSNRKTPLAEFADCCLFYEAAEPILKIDAVGLKIAQIFVLEVIYAQIIKENPDIAPEIRSRVAQAAKVLNLNKKKGAADKQ